MINILLVIIIIFIIIVVFQFRIIIIKNRKDEINNRMMMISEKLIDFKDIDVLYKELLGETINLIQGAESGSILIYNKEKDYMEYKACIGYDADVLSKIHLKKEELFLFDKTDLQSPYIIKNPFAFYKEKLEKYNFDDMQKSNYLSIKSSLCAPIFINGEFLGTITVDSKSKESAFDKNYIKQIGHLCRQIEIAIKNVVLMKELEVSMRTDKLTNSYNRRFFEETLEKSFINGGVNRKVFSVIMIDIDDFKIINDTHGHKIGDEVLIYFAQALNKNVRDEDLVVRYAGDEFVLLLNNTDEKGALFVIDRIRESLIEYSREDIKINFSAGICEHIEGLDLDKLVTIADDNMYKEKRKMKN